MNDTDPISAYAIKKYSSGKFESCSDQVIIESPLEICVNGQLRYKVMRMPGMDKELALGICFQEGLLKSYEDVEEIREDHEDISVINIILGTCPSNGFSGKIVSINSSSGLLSNFDKRISETGQSKGSHKTFFVNSSLLFSIQKKFFKSQKVFERTGCTHAAAIFSYEGQQLAFAEDVGRHNALDKCAGQLIMQNIMPLASIVMLSSRISSEMIAKSVTLGVDVIAGISAPTSMAVDMARRESLILIGFLRENRFNLYAGDKQLLE